MTLDYTSDLPYRERNFVIDPSDRDLFVKMKSIVDCGFPDAVDPMLLELYKQCWEKHRKIRYREVGNATIYIDFPKINPLIRFIGGIMLFFVRKNKELENKEKEEE